MSELERTCRSSAVLPTELEPKSTVKAGTDPKARSIALISFGRSKNPGRGEKVCEAGTVESEYKTIKREQRPERERLRSTQTRETLREI